MHRAIIGEGAADDIRGPPILTGPNLGQNLWPNDRGSPDVGPTESADGELCEYYAATKTPISSRLPGQHHQSRAPDARMNALSPKSTNSADTVRIAVELSAAVVPIGRLYGNGIDVGFCGWMELVAALEVALSEVNRSVACSEG